MTSRSNITGGGGARAPLSRGPRRDTFRLTISTDNAAFDANANAALAGILRDTAQRIEQYVSEGCIGGIVFDASGNACGHWSVTR